MSAGHSLVPGVTHRRVRANGLDFHVAECGAGDRLALCLHGFPELWLSWRHQLPLLERLGYRVWAPDLRGYGETERPSATAAYDLDVLVEDVAGLIDAAAPRETLLVGHDWGGIIAWAFAMRKLRRLDRLVVLNFPHPSCFFRELRGLRQLGLSWYMFAFQLPWLPERLLGLRRAAFVERMFATSVSREPQPPELVEAYRAAAAAPGALKAMLDYYRMLFRGPGGRRLRHDDPGVIETPTLVVWGEGDIALGEPTTRGMHAYARHLDLHRIPGATHFVQLDAPDAVNAALEAWLAGRPLPAHGA